MLALSRNKRQTIVLTTKSNEIIVVHFADKCRVGIDAPETVRIQRGELVMEEKRDGRRDEAA